MLGESERTIRRWCESGKITAIPVPYGTKVQYQIPLQVLTLLQEEAQQAKLEPQPVPIKQNPHSELLQKWKKAMEKGLISGRVFSTRTIDDYWHYGQAVFKRHHNLTVDVMRKELMRIPAHQIAKRQHLYKAMVCFAKFLIIEGYLEPEFIKQVNHLAPRRHLPAKRLTINADELQAMLNSGKK